MGKRVTWRTACGNAMEMAMLWNTIWELRHTFKQGMEFRSSITNEMVIVKAVRASHLPPQHSKGLRRRVSPKIFLLRYQLRPTEVSATDINITTDFLKWQASFTKLWLCLYTEVKQGEEQPFNNFKRSQFVPLKELILNYLLRGWLQLLFFLAWIRCSVCWCHAEDLNVPHIWSRLGLWQLLHSWWQQRLVSSSLSSPWCYTRWMGGIDSDWHIHSHAFKAHEFYLTRPFAYWLGFNWSDVLQHC